MKAVNIDITLSLLVAYIHVTYISIYHQVDDIQSRQIKNGIFILKKAWLHKHDFGKISILHTSDTTDNNNDDIKLKYNI